MSESPPVPLQAVSDAELLAYHDRLLEHRPRLEAFSVLRAALAPLVEAVVLLDRLAFLLEQVCRQLVFRGGDRPAGTACVVGGAQGCQLLYVFRRFCRLFHRACEENTVC